MIYNQTQISLNQFERIFSEQVDSSELVWHRDKNNRWVDVVEGGDWKFQMEDELPITLTNGMRIFIPKESFHRVIKGSKQLKVLITEETDD